MGKYTIEQVRKEFKDKGYELISNEYNGVKQKLTAKDNEGYLVYVTLDNFRYGKPCIIHSNNPYTLDNIRLWLSRNKPNYKLVSETYSKNNEELVFICDKHGKFNSTWAKIISGNGCQKCGNEKKGQYNKIDFELIKKDFIKHGFEVLNDNYLNVHQTLYVRNIEGYIGMTSYARFKYGNNSSFFHPSNPYTIENIKLWLKLNGNNYELISKEYVNADDHLILNCKKHGEFKMTWSNLQGGYGCKQCGNEKIGDLKRNDIQTVIDLFYENGLTPMFSIYSDCHEDLFAKTSEGYIVKTCYSSLLQGNNPSIFHSNNPYTIENIKLWLKLNGDKYELISTEYEKAILNLKVFCKEHRIIFNISWNNLSKGEGCYNCGIDKRSGTNACNYNPNLTEEERILKRNYIGKENYSNWRNKVFERDNYTCKICGQVSGKINAHHLDGYNWNVEGRLDVENGITLCEIHHKEFHKIYGRGNNTKEQFEQFLKTKICVKKEVI